MRCGTEGEFLCIECLPALSYKAPSCIVCGKLVPARNMVIPGRTCMGCRKKSYIYAFISPFLYEEKPIRDLIHLFKYKRIASLAEVFARCIFFYLGHFSIAFKRDLVLIPIPLHPSRERVRGFNQSVLLADEIARILDVSIGSDFLIKIKSTKNQIELTAEKRENNILGAFAVMSREQIKNKTIVLIDDVKTTGATLEEAARVLKEAGAKRVWAVTIAH